MKTLVGNKCDLDNLRAVSTDRGAEAAEKYNIPFIETSALKEINIKKLFYDMARTLVENVIFLVFVLIELTKEMF